MTINSNLFVLFMLLLMIVVGVVAWRLAGARAATRGLSPSCACCSAWCRPLPCWRCSFWRSGGTYPQAPMPGKPSPLSRHCRSHRKAPCGALLLECPAAGGRLEGQDRVMAPTCRGQRAEHGPRAHSCSAPWGRRSIPSA